MQRRREEPCHRRLFYSGATRVLVLPCYTRPARIKDDLPVSGRVAWRARIGTSLRAFSIFFLLFLRGGGEMSGGRWIGGSEGVGGTLRFLKRINKITTGNLQRHQSGAAEAWWAHNPQVPGSKPGSDNFSYVLPKSFFFLLFFSLLSFA